MKQALQWVALLLIVCCLSIAQAETPLGFGYINTNQTNVRESIRGPIVTRLDEGDPVYILNQEVDSQEVLWYYINTEDSNAKPISVWVQARYVTAGSELFYDIVQVATGRHGMLSLQSDGTVVGVADENIGTRIFCETIADWTNVKQVACGFMTYIALLEDGSLRGFGNMAYEDWDTIANVRLLDAEDLKIAFVTEDGVCNQENYSTCYTLGEPLDWNRATQIIATSYGTIALYPEGNITCVFYMSQTLPSYYEGIGSWNDLVMIDCGDCSLTIEGTYDVEIDLLLVGLHTDGTVSTMPVDVFPDIISWTDIISVRAGWDFVIGLRADGTVIAAGGDDYDISEQVSQWTNITSIDACKHYCVGVKDDGTLVFAGEYTFQ